MVKILRMTSHAVTQHTLPLGETLLVHLQPSGHHGWVGGGIVEQGVSDMPLPS